MRLAVAPLSLALAAFASAQTWQPLGPARYYVGDVHTDQVISFDDSTWSTALPEAFSGRPTWVSWHFTPEAATRGQDLLVELGDEEATNVTYCNGAAVAGGLGQGGQAVFVVPALLAQPGRDNVLAVHVTDAAGWAAVRAGRFGWVRLADEQARFLALDRAASAALERRFAPLGAGACDFLLRGLRAADIASASGSPWRTAELWRRLRVIQADPERYARDWRAYSACDPLDFMRDSEMYRVLDFSGPALQKPAMGSELSDFGSWYDVAYSGGLNRFYLGSVRQGVGPDHEFFNTARDVGLLALYVRKGKDEIVDGGEKDSAVTWLPYGWRTTTRQAGLEIESRAFFAGFDTLAIYGRVTNRGSEPVPIAPGLLVTARSNYDGRTGGRVTGRFESGGRLLLRNVRAGLSTTPALYGDTLSIGCTLPGCTGAFTSLPCPSARGGALRAAAAEASAPALDAAAGTARLESSPVTLAPGASLEFSFAVAAAAADGDAEKACAQRLQAWIGAPREAVTQADSDWGRFLSGLPRLHHPGYAEAKLYYAAATALRKNRYLYRDEGTLYSASFPARGGFNYFYQSDSCWNLLGYLDFRPPWAEGHAVPILVPPCQIMDPHFFWSMWELYSRLPDAGQRRAFAELVYPLLEHAYRTWLSDVDTDHDLLVATPDNWDDNPRYDLFFKEEPYVPGWNSWWNDLVRACREAPIDDPAPSSQLGYGAVVLGRLARILGRDADARQWDEQVRRHVAAVNSLWDETRGYWTVSYRHTERDDVLTSSIIYPIFTDLCRDPARIRRVIETHVLNPGEFDGRFPIPTVAYDSPRFYHQKPPFQDEPGGLWRGALWMPEGWIVVKGLYKYGYEAEAKRIARTWIDMMAHQSASVGPYAALSFSPSEWYDSRTGLAQNNRAFSWSSAVALDLLLGNYQNERVVGANPARDGAIDGHIREIYAFADDHPLFRVYPGKTVFPVLHMRSTDGLPIGRSRRVAFSFADPAGNFPEAIAFCADDAKWRVVSAETGGALAPGADGLYRARAGTRLALVPR
jgi:hypothetical protein